MQQLAPQRPQDNIEAELEGLAHVVGVVKFRASAVVREQSIKRALFIEYLAQMLIEELTSESLRSDDL